MKNIDNKIFMSNETDLVRNNKLTSGLKRVIKTPKLLIGILAVLALAILISIYSMDKDQQLKEDNNQKVYSSDIEAAKENIKTEDDVRAYSTILEANKNYEEAYKQLDALVAKNQNPVDATSLLNLCVNRNIDQKTDCVSKAEDVLKKRVSELDFFVAYSAASLLDKENRKQTSKLLYQRALDEYIEQINQGEANFMSKAELTEYIRKL